MILYAFPFSCSLAVHLVLQEHGITPEVRWVGRGEGRRVASEQLGALNPKRKAPTLVLDDGTVLTEVVSVLDYLDERFDPARDEAERRRRLEWLACLATDLHQPVLAPFYDPNADDHIRHDITRRILPPAIEHLASSLDGRTSVLDRPCSADAYAFWALLLVRHGIEEQLPVSAVGSFMKHWMVRPSTRTVLSAEQAARAAA